MFDLESIPKTIHVPFGEYSTELVRGSNSSLKGLQKMRLNILVDNKIQRKVPIHIYVRHFKSVWVATEKISRGKILPENSLVKERRDITRLAGVPIDNLKQFSDEQIKSLEAGQGDGGISPIQGQEGFNSIA